MVELKNYILHYCPLNNEDLTTVLSRFTAKTILHNTTIKVNSVSPGWVKTDLAGPDAPMQVADGARIIVKAATLPGDGPTGSFFTHEMRIVPW
jgi:NAD(P)-dependent dehydrogenase (short-subunit alcohol dehydrogenase family)